MAAFSRIRAGDVLYDARRSTGVSSLYHEWDVWEVKVISVDSEARTAIVSWNGNKPTTYGEHSLGRLRRTPPRDKRAERPRRPA